MRWFYIAAFVAILFLLPGIRGTRTQASWDLAVQTALETQAAAEQEAACSTPNRRGEIFAVDCGVTVGDETDDTAALQLAMDNAFDAGGATVILPQGEMRWSDHDGDSKGLIMRGMSVRCPRHKACTLRWTQPPAPGVVGLYWNSAQRLPDGRLAPNPGSIHAGWYSTTMRSLRNEDTYPGRAWILYGGFDGEGQGMDQFTRIDNNHFGNCGDSCIEISSGCINCRMYGNRFDNTKAAVLTIDFKGAYFRNAIFDTFTIDVSNTASSGIPLRLFDFYGSNNVGDIVISNARIEANASSITPGMCLVHFTRSGAGFIGVTLDNIDSQTGFNNGTTIFCGANEGGGDGRMRGIMRGGALEHEFALAGFRQSLIDMWQPPVLQNRGPHSGTYWWFDTRESDELNRTQRLGLLPQ